MLDESPTKGFVWEDAVLGPYKYDGTLARTGFLASIPMCSNSNTLYIDQTTDPFPGTLGSLVFASSSQKRTKSYICSDNDEQE
jgi:hypothetical protein